MTRKGSIILIVVLLLGGILFANLFFNRKSKNPVVRVVTIARGNLKSYLSTSAVIKPKVSKEYYGLQLPVSRVNVKVGDEVKKGDILVSYDASDLLNAVDQAEINYSNAVLQKKILQKNNDEVRSLDKEISNLEDQIKKLADNPMNSLQITELQRSLSEIKQRRALQKPVTQEQLKQADNSINLASLALQAARNRVGGGKEQITAEFDGVITAVNVAEGGIANPAMPAVVEMDLKSLKAVVSAGKYDAPKIKVGQYAEIKAYDELIEGKVAFMEPVAKKVLSPTGGDTALNVEIDILGSTKKLKVDFDTDINILVGEAANVIKVPAEAIKSDKEGNSYVFIVKNDKAVERKITLGIQSDMESEVKEGLKEGERVILNPIASIKNGTTIAENQEG